MEREKINKLMSYYHNGKGFIRTKQMFNSHDPLAISNISDVCNIKLYWTMLKKHPTVLSIFVTYQFWAHQPLMIYVPDPLNTSLIQVCLGPGWTNKSGWWKNIPAIRQKPIKGLIEEYPLQGSNSLIPGRSDCNFKCVIPRHILVINTLGFPSEIAPRWMPYDKSMVMQVIAW